MADEEQKDNLPEFMKQYPKEKQTKIMLRALVAQKTAGRYLKKKEDEKKAKRNKIWEYVLIRIGAIGITVFIVLILWVLAIIPHKYSSFILYFGLGLFIGFIIGFNRKK